MSKSRLHTLTSEKEVKSDGLGQWLSNAPVLDIVTQYVSFVQRRRVQSVFDKYLRDIVSGCSQGHSSSHSSSIHSEGSLQIRSSQLPRKDSTWCCALQVSALSQVS